VSALSGKIFFEDAVFVSAKITGVGFHRGRGSLPTFYFRLALRTRDLFHTQIPSTLCTGTGTSDHAREVRFMVKKARPYENRVLHCRGDPCGRPATKRLRTQSCLNTKGKENGKGTARALSF
jgi:hypothetical protein